MDGSHFDTLARAFATSGTRRRLVALLAALSLGAVLTTLGEDAAAAERPIDRVQQRTPQRNRKQRNNQNNQNKNKNKNGGGGGVRGTTPCRGIDCPAGTDCCGDSFHPVCCPAGQTCCGTSGFGQCCSADPTVAVCCGPGPAAQCCDRKTQICCGTGDQAQCCNSQLFQCCGTEDTAQCCPAPSFDFVCCGDLGNQCCHR